MILRRHSLSTRRCRDRLPRRLGGCTDRPSALRASVKIARRRAEEERAEALSLCERRRSRRAPRAIARAAQRSVRWIRLKRLHEEERQSQHCVNGEQLNTLVPGGLAALGDLVG